MASIPHTTHASHDGKVRRGQRQFPAAGSCRRLTIHSSSLPALALPAPAGAEEGLPFPLPSPAGGAAPPRSGLRPCLPGVPEPRGQRRGRSPLPVPPAVPPPPLAGAPWNSMTPGGAGRAARLSRPRPGRVFLRELSCVPDGRSAAPALPLPALAVFKRVRNTADRTTRYCLPREGKTIPVLSGFAPSLINAINAIKAVLFPGCRNRYGPLSFATNAI